MREEKPVQRVNKNAPAKVSRILSELTVTRGKEVIEVG